MMDNNKQQTVVDDVVLDILRQTFTTLNAFLQLGVGNITSNDQRAAQ